MFREYINLSLSRFMTRTRRTLFWSTYKTRKERQVQKKIFLNQFCAAEKLSWLILFSLIFKAMKTLVIIISIFSNIFKTRINYLIILCCFWILKKPNMLRSMFHCSNTYDRMHINLIKENKFRNSKPAKNLKLKLKLT